MTVFPKRFRTGALYSIPRINLQDAVDEGVELVGAEG
jgi:hypothetical protein